MDTKLSEFTTRTSCDPGLALDLLKCHQWVLKDALNAYYVIKGMVQEDEPTGLLGKDEIEGGLDVQFRLPTVSCGSLPSLPSPSSPPPDAINSTTSSTNSSPSKLAISRTDLRQDVSNVIYPLKTLSRGISKAVDNVNIVSRARSEFAQEISASLKGSEIEEKEVSIDTFDKLYQKSPETFTLPDLSIHPPDFSDFLKKDLIEKSSLKSLEEANRLNWWADLGICQRLWPLATSGDGNCLLHAASLGMWGFHDRLLTLRKALHAVLSSSSFTDSLYRRWRWQTSMQHKAADLILCNEEWQKDWANLLRMASTEPRVRASTTDSDEEKKSGLAGGKKSETLPEDELQPHVYESLEELHIMALAHVLHRPIIVVADTMLKDVKGEPFAPIPFGGIYLPLECDPRKCHRSPLCLTYDAAHFSALVAMDKETYADDTPKLPAAIPLVDSECNLLSLQFSIDPGSKVSWNEDENDDSVIETNALSFEEQINLLSMYLDILYIDKPSTDNTCINSTTETKYSANNTSTTTARKHDDTCNSNSSSNDSVKNVSTAAKSANLSCNIDIESPKSTLVDSFSAQSGNVHAKRRKFKFLNNFLFVFIKKRFGKRFKKNITTFARNASMRLRKKSTSLATDKATNKSTNKSSTGTAGEDNRTKGTDDCTSSSYARKKNQFICAVLHTEKKPDYREEMIRNYLSSARIRFGLTVKDEDNSSDDSTATTDSTSSTVSDNGKKDEHTAIQDDIKSSAIEKIGDNNRVKEIDKIDTSTVDSVSSPVINVDHTVPCAHDGCNHYGTADTNYLCSKCFQIQQVTARNLQNDCTDL